MICHNEKEYDIYNAGIIKGEMMAYEKILMCLGILEKPEPIHFDTEIRRKAGK